MQEEDRTMMGQKKFNMKQHHNLCLDDFVKPGNLYRKIDEAIDFSFIYDLSKERYSQTGQPSLDPVVFFKIELVSFLEGIHEDRALERRLHDSFAIRWFLGYDLDEAPPVHSTISRTRKDRITPELYEAVFSHILSLCVRHQLVSGSHQSIDSTLLKANSSLHSLEILKPKVHEHYQKMTATNPASEQEGKPELPSDTPALPTVRDPEAKVTQKPGFRSSAYYKASASTDPLCGIITQAQVDDANQNDAELLGSLISKTKESLARYGLAFKSLGVDAGYYSAENLKAAEDKSLELFIPPNLQTQDNGLFRRDRFQYDPAQDQFTCPQGKTLQFRGLGKRPHIKKYQARISDCQICPQKTLCTRGKVKVIQQSIHYKLIEQACQRLQSAEGKAAMRLRRIQAEGSFAHLKTVLKFVRLSCLGLANAKKKFLMGCSVINLKKLINALSLSLQRLVNFWAQKLTFFKEQLVSQSPEGSCLC
jgi:transposase